MALTVWGDDVSTLLPLSAAAVSQQVLNLGICSQFGQFSFLSIGPVKVIKGVNSQSDANSMAVLDKWSTESCVH